MTAWWIGGTLTEGALFVCLAHVRTVPNHFWTVEKINYNQGHGIADIANRY